MWWQVRTELQARLAEEQVKCLKAAAKFAEEQAVELFFAEMEALGPEQEKPIYPAEFYHGMDCYLDDIHQHLLRLSDDFERETGSYFPGRNWWWSSYDFTQRFQELFGASYRPDEEWYNEMEFAESSMDSDN